MNGPFDDPRRRQRYAGGGMPTFTATTFTGNIGRDRSADAVSAPSSIQLGAGMPGGGAGDPYATDSAGNAFIKSDAQMNADRQAARDQATAQNAGSREAALGSAYQKGYNGQMGIAQPGPFTPPPAGGVAAQPIAPGQSAMAPGTSPGVVHPPAAPMPGQAPLNPTVPSNYPATGRGADMLATAAFQRQQMQPPTGGAFSQTTAPAPMPAGSGMGGGMATPPAVTSRTFSDGKGNTATGRNFAPGTTPAQMAASGTVAIPGNASGSIPAQNVPTQEAQRLASPQQVTLPDGSTKPAPSLLAVTDGPGAINNTVDQNRTAASMGADPMGLNRPAQAAVAPPRPAGLGAGMAAPGPFGQPTTMLTSDAKRKKQKMTPFRT